jgi:hypothetical protein
MKRKLVDVMSLSWNRLLLAGSCFGAEGNNCCDCGGHDRRLIRLHGWDIGKLLVWMHLRAIEWRFSRPPWPRSLLLLIRHFPLFGHIISAPEELGLVRFNMDSQDLSAFVRMSEWHLSDMIKKTCSRIGVLSGLKFDCRTDKPQPYGVVRRPILKVIRLHPYAQHLWRSERLDRLSP